MYLIYSSYDITVVYVHMFTMLGYSVTPKWVQTPKWRAQLLSASHAVILKSSGVFHIRRHWKHDIVDTFTHHFCAIGHGGTIGTSFPINRGVEPL